MNENNMTFRNIAQRMNLTKSKSDVFRLSEQIGDLTEICHGHFLTQPTSQFNLNKACNPHSVFEQKK